MNPIHLLKLIFLTLIYGFINGQSNHISADNKRIKYMGRIDFSNPQNPSYSYPGVTISAKFKGTSIMGIIKDFGTSGQETTNYYNVVVDDKILHKIKVNRNDTIYKLASGLSDTIHEIKLIKRTESSVGKSSFGGFLIEEDNLLMPESLPGFKMEFIGDSWTCGYGNEISTTSPNTGFHSVNEDNSKAWGYILAKRFNAQYHATALSGRGMYRNNTGKTSAVVPNEFNFIHSGNTPWNHSNYIPDVVCIHLGTNDFFPETIAPVSMLDSASYVNKYINFISTVRQKYGSKTKIICVYGNSKTDWWPSGLKHLTRWRNYITAVVNYLNNAGDDKVYKFEQKPQNSPYGEDWHPTIESHNKMAVEISPFIKELTGKNYNDYTASTNVPSILSTYVKKENINFKIYPNPSVETISIQGIEENEKWSLYNQKGVIVLKGSGNKINLSRIISGKYVLLVKDQKYKIIKK